MRAGQPGTRSFLGSARRKKRDKKYAEMHRICRQSGHRKMAFICNSFLPASGMLGANARGKIEYQQGWQFIATRQ
jgi:hypothetical protein